MPPSKHGKEFELCLVNEMGLILCRSGFDKHEVAIANYENCVEFLKAGRRSPPDAHGAWLRSTRNRGTLGLYMPDLKPELEMHVAITMAKDANPDMPEAPGAIGAKVPCPKCPHGEILVREYTGEWTSACQGEAATQHYWGAWAICGCDLSESESIAAWKQAVELGLK